MTPLRILHCIYDHAGNPWVGGGGAVRAYEILKRLSLRGHKITVLSGKYPDAKDYEEGLLRYKFLGSGKNYLISTFSFAYNAAGYIKTHSPDYDMVVEDFAPWNPLFSVYLSSSPTVLHVNHREGAGILRRWYIAGLPFYLIEAFYPRLFKHVTALSEWTKKKINTPDAFVLPAGINEEILIGERNTSDEGFIYYVGRLHIKNKGLDTLIEAVRRTGYRLIVAGRGRDEDKLKEMSKGLDIEFLGFVDEKRKMDLMRRASLFVLPSRFEGWGIVILEAAACGKPVLVSDIPELDYSVKGGFGVSFKKGDAEGLSKRLRELMENKALRTVMGRKAGKYAVDYTWGKIADDYEAFLKGIAEGKNR